MTGTWSRRSEEWTYHPFAQAKEFLQFYRDFSLATHEEVTTYAGLLTSPDGAKKVPISVCYSGPLEEGERLIAPVRQFGRPLADEIQPMGYARLQSMFDAADPPRKMSRHTSMREECVTWQYICS